jgi:hypothetical protein
MLPAAAVVNAGLNFLIFTSRLTIGPYSRCLRIKRFEKAEAQLNVTLMPDLPSGVLQGKLPFRSQISPQRFE